MALFEYPRPEELVRQDHRSASGDRVEDGFRTERRCGTAKLLPSSPSPTSHDPRMHGARRVLPTTSTPTELHCPSSDTRLERTRGGALDREQHKVVQRRAGKVSCLADPEGVERVSFSAQHQCARTHDELFHLPRNAVREQTLGRLERARSPLSEHVDLIAVLRHALELPPETNMRQPGREENVTSRAHPGRRTRNTIDCLCAKRCPGNASRS